MDINLYRAEIKFQLHLHRTDKFFRSDLASRLACLARCHESFFWPCTDQYFLLSVMIAFQERPSLYNDHYSHPKVVAVEGINPSLTTAYNMIKTLHLIRFWWCFLAVYFPPETTIVSIYDKVKQHEPFIARCSFEFYSRSQVLDELLEKATDPSQLLCDSLGVSTGNITMFDEVIASKIQQKSPNEFHLLDIPQTGQAGLFCIIVGT